MRPRLARVERQSCWSLGRLLVEVVILQIQVRELLFVLYLYAMILNTTISSRCRVQLRLGLGSAAMQVWCGFSELCETRSNKLHIARPYIFSEYSGAQQPISITVCSLFR